MFGFVIVNGRCRNVVLLYTIGSTMKLREKMEHCKQSLLF